MPIKYLSDLEIKGNINIEGNINGYSINDETNVLEKNENNINFTIPQKIVVWDRDKVNYSINLLPEQWMSIYSCRPSTLQGFGPSWLSQNSILEFIFDKAGPIYVKLFYHYNTVDGATTNIITGATTQDCCSHSVIVGVGAFPSSTQLTNIDWNDGLTSNSSYGIYGIFIPKTNTGLNFEITENERCSLKKVYQIFEPSIIKTYPDEIE